ncbi:unnamed protein product [Paramecium sonneborni]|uniref:Uncharacterized protein n=1 Tax=Paramecium sonneborni TaxID=65129 RepID=A0A8S1JXD1_9CILI|nr:unnamed protein product [Paramecium sonneborni]
MGIMMMELELVNGLLLNMVQIQLMVEVNIHQKEQRLIHRLIHGLKLFHILDIAIQQFLSILEIKIMIQDLVNGRLCIKNRQVADLIQQME